MIKKKKKKIPDISLWRDHTNRGLRGKVLILHLYSLSKDESKNFFKCFFPCWVFLHHLFANRTRGVKWEFPHLQAELSFGSALLLTFFFSSSSFQGKWGGWWKHKWWTPFVLSDICIFRTKTSAWHYWASKASRSDGSAQEPYLNSLDLFMPLSPPLILPM